MEGQAKALGTTRGAGLLSERLFWVWIAVAGTTSAIFFAQPLYPNLIGPISNVIPSAAAANAFASALLCWRRYGFELRHRYDAVWFSFSLGTGLWLLAELTWATYYFVMRVPVPYPSLADVFYEGGYLPMIAALFLYLSVFRVAMSRSRLAVALLGIAASTSMALAFVLPVELSKGLPMLNMVTDLTYPMLDLVLVSLTILSLAIFIGGTISRWWVTFGAASALYVIADEYFLYLVASNAYYNGSFDDLIFILGYLTFALAFFAHRREF